MPSAGIKDYFHFSRRALPVLLQSEAMECGLICISMISAFYGKFLDTHQMRQTKPLSNRGMTLKDLAHLASELGFATRAVSLDINDVRQLQTPCVLHWKMDHFVVLRKSTARGFIIHDPAVGERTVNHKEFDRHFTGVALELNPTEDFKKDHTKRRLRISDLWSKAVGIRRNIANVLFLTLVMQALALTSPYYLQLVVDHSIASSDLSVLSVLALGFFLLLLLEVTVFVGRGIILQFFSHSLDLHMSTNVFRHLLRLPMSYFYARHVADITSRFNSLKEIRHLLTTGVIHAFLDALVSLVAWLIIAFYSLPLALFTGFASLLYTAYRFASYRTQKRLAHEAIVAQSSHDAHFIESIQAIQTVRLFQHEDSRQEEWLNRLTNAAGKNIACGSWDITNNGINKFLFGLQGIIFVYLAATLVVGGQLTLGMFFAVLTYKNRFNSAINSVIKHTIRIKMLDVHLERLADIAFTDRVSVEPRVTSTANDSIRGTISVQEASFKYPGDSSPLFEGVSFDVKSGEAVAITGPSGCGKTTLMKCLMGLLQPSSGHICVDGVHLHSLPNYGRQIAAVMQDDRLLTGSIAENIACFSKPTDADLVEECARLAGIEQDILSMPMQYNTLVGDMGTALSGGQRQRIFLARAFYRRPKILFLDEATSHLDLETEFIVNKQIKSLAITRVIIAHRPETIRSADREISLTQFRNRNEHDNPKGLCCN